MQSLEVLKTHRSRDFDSNIGLVLFRYYFWPYCRKPDFVACGQQRFRPACTSAQVDLHLCCCKYLTLPRTKFQYSDFFSAGND